MITAEEIARRADGEISGDPDARVRAVAPLDSAGPDELSFVANPRYLGRAAGTRAGVVLVPRGAACELPAGTTAVHVADPYLVLSWLLPLLHPEDPQPPGVHPTALIDPEARIDDGVRIGPYVTVGRGATIGAGATIAAHVSVGAGCSVGPGSFIHPHVTLHDGVTIGQGCVLHSGVRLGVPLRSIGNAAGTPAGGCVVEDEVEIGANTVVERGTVSRTRIGAGAKLDNLVHVGRDVTVGPGALLAGQAGVGEGASIGSGAILGGQSGVGDHVRIGDRARLAGKAGAARPVPDGETVSGVPARPHRESMRAQAALARLPDIFRKLQELERTLRARDGRPSDR